LGRTDCRRTSGFGPQKNSLFVPRCCDVCVSLALSSPFQGFGPFLVCLAPTHAHAPMRPADGSAGDGGCGCCAASREPIAAKAGAALAVDACNTLERSSRCCGCAYAVVDWSGGAAMYIDIDLPLPPRSRSRLFEREAAAASTGVVFACSLVRASRAAWPSIVSSLPGWLLRPTQGTHGRSDFATCIFHALITTSCGGDPPVQGRKCLLSAWIWGLGGSCSLVRASPTAAQQPGRRDDESASKVRKKKKWAGGKAPHWLKRPFLIDGVSLRPIDS
jgi:hypothetical protein